MEKSELFFYTIRFWGFSDQFLKRKCGGAVAGVYRTKRRLAGTMKIVSCPLESPGSGLLFHQIVARQY
jgi:hypothetical protein